MRKTQRPRMDQKDGDHSFLVSRPDLPRINLTPPARARRREALLARIGQGVARRWFAFTTQYAHRCDERYRRIMNYDSWQWWRRVIQWRPVRLLRWWGARLWIALTTFVATMLLNKTD